MLSALIKKYNIYVDMLRLKIAETAFAEQSREIIEKVAQPTEFGHVVEIDYFGSGYSSLNTLKDVPTSVLKIDMRFFESAESNHRAGNIIESVVRMAKLLDMAVIAEGAEPHGAAVSKYMDEKGRKILFSTIDRAVATRREASCEVKVSDCGQTEYIRVTVRAIARAYDRILCYDVVVNMTEQRVAEINERNMITRLDTILGSIHASVIATVFDGGEMKVIFKNNGFSVCTAIRGSSSIMR